MSLKKSLISLGITWGISLFPIIFFFDSPFDKQRSFLLTAIGMCILSLIVIGICRGAPSQLSLKKLIISLNLSIIPALLFASLLAGTSESLVPTSFTYFVYKDFIVLFVMFLTWIASGITLGKLLLRALAKM